MRLQSFYFPKTDFNILHDVLHTMYLFFSYIFHIFQRILFFTKFSKRPPLKIYGTGDYSILSASKMADVFVYFYTGFIVDLFYQSKRYFIHKCYKLQVLTT